MVMPKIACLKIIMHYMALRYITEQSRDPILNPTMHHMAVQYMIPMPMIQHSQTMLLS